VQQVHAVGRGERIQPVDRLADRHGAGVTRPELRERAEGKSQITSAIEIKSATFGSSSRVRSPTGTISSVSRHSPWIP
jgi:hypothetical protein